MVDLKLLNTEFAEIQRVFELQKQNKQKLRQSTAESRIAKLQALKEQILADKDRLYAALAADYKKPRLEGDLTEVLPTLAELSEAIGNLKSWMRPRNVSSPFHMLGAQSEIHYEALGQSLIIAPWNYPLQLTICPLVAAIAAGNTVVIKPSEFTPNTALVIEELLAKVFSEDEVRVIQGDGETAAELLKLPFDHIFFTGSTAIGKKVMRAAAENLTKVTLELGGKSPVIIDKSADLKDAAKKIAWGKFINAGQTCVAPDYVLVPQELKTKFVNYLRDALQTFYGAEEKNWQNNSDFCRIVNDRHYDRLQDLIDDAVDKGAKIVIGGEKLKSERYLAPTVITNISADSKLLREEIFGPILPIIDVADLAESLALVTGREKPLALYIFATDSKVVKTVLNQTSSGGICINDTVVHLGNPKLPFGGVNHSGLGSYHGEFGFKAFSHEKAVFKQNPLFSAVQAFYPPYNNSVTEVIQTLMRKLL